jgi:hypothetical protein
MHAFGQNYQDNQTGVRQANLCVLHCYTDKNGEKNMGQKLNTHVAADVAQSATYIGRQLSTVHVVRVMVCVFQHLHITILHLEHC